MGGDARLQHPLPKPVKERGWGCVCTGRGRQMLLPSCPADKEELHNKCLREARVCARERERWMGPQGGREKGGPRGKAQSSASWGSQGPRGHGAQDTGQLQGSQISRKPLPHQTQALVFPPFPPPPGGRSLCRSTPDIWGLTAPSFSAARGPSTV